MKRSTGVLMHVSSLWGDYGCGAFGRSAFEWIDFLKNGGFAVWQVLPFNLPDEYHSPYKSFSAFSFNPAFIDLDRLVEDGLLTTAETATAKQKSPYLCEFDRLGDDRLALLNKAMQRFTAWDKVDAFCLAHPENTAFCHFLALKKANGDLPCDLWTVLEADPSVEKLWRFTQYVFFTQWQKVKAYANAQGIAVVGDVPIYVSADSSDVYADRTDFMLDGDGRPAWVAGVPPDYFCPDGQKWGNPLYDWKRMKDNGYRFWTARLRLMNELFDGVRIDHFRGLESFYAVPADAENAKNGKWMKGPGMDFVRIVQKTCAGKLVIAEDLGVITEKVAKLVERSTFPGMRVLQFAFDGNPDCPHLPHNYPENCVAYTGTHDNNTLLGHIWEMGERERRDLFEYVNFDGENWNDSQNAIFKTMYQSRASLVMFPVQDLLFYGEDTRFNTPGKSQGNWAYRLTRDQLDRIDQNKFKRWSTLYGRNHSLV